ncbi:MAG: fructosamine kinase family protein [Bacteroidetes bacterium]|nr:fructosamine kinase family protein [Bacteroidota bacterium]
MKPDNYLLDSLFPGERITSISPIKGSSLNSIFRIETESGQFFLKILTDKNSFEIIQGEAAGLKAISATKSIRTPDVIKTVEEPQPHLLLSFIETETPKSEFWTKFGTELAALHRNTAKEFGFDVPTFCGNIQMSNRHHANWNDFYFAERLEPEFRFCRDEGLFTSTDSSLFNQFANWYHEESRFPVEPPALIHGDLWSGNFLCGSNQTPYLIDPSVYYGHREIDLGMSELFGGFAPGFYQSYREVYPQEPGWEFRRQLAQLYHLLLHVHLFGGSFTDQALHIFRFYCFRK